MISFLKISDIPGMAINLFFFTAENTELAEKKLEGLSLNNKDCMNDISAGGFYKKFERD